MGKTKTKNSKKKKKKTQQTSSKRKKVTSKVVPGKNPKYFLKDKKNKTAYFDISIGGDDSKRIEMVIFNGIVPKTAANFLSFCKGKKINKKTLKYKGTAFHRMIIGFMLQGGDVMNADGTGMVSSFKDRNYEAFDDENFKIKHCQYALSMANAGPNTNGSQFFICTDECAHLDGKHVVFGYIDKKYHGVVDEMEEEGASLDGQPKIECKITGCGVKK